LLRFRLTVRLLAPPQREAAALVAELRVIPTPLPPGGRTRSDGSVDPAEERREAVYKRLRELGPHGAVALESALRDREIGMRRGAALALLAVSATWWDRWQPPLDLRVSLPGLITALDDPDDSVRGWVAQAIGNIGADAAPAVPALIALLSNEGAASRNSACIALRDIGSAAKDALPALRTALNGPGADVRDLAQRAIEKIEKQQ
jgi:HEAT repeat protein